jgi:hypothetical protein
MIQIEEGKFYKTRTGRKVGPMVPELRGYRKPFKWTTPELDSPWCDDGSYMNKDRKSDEDLVAEWVETNTSPVRTETRKVVVPGSYSNVKVEPGYEPSRIGVSIPRVSLNAEQLRAASDVFLALVDALESNK